MSKTVRQLHRWVAIAFLVLVVAVTVVVVTAEEPAEWVYLSPLLPLFLLMASGLYLLVLPYRRRRA